MDDGVTVLEFSECLLAILFSSSLLWSMSLKNSLRGWTKLSCGNLYKPVSINFLSLLIHIFVCVDKYSQDSATYSVFNRRTCHKLVW